ncbi:DUF2306 domain-containing protein [Paenibacillus alkalitolerans]|uniref:DUF2306 domain-containing protein n=1 Tax=Paenibacillus alkalitolerans TaxID=2799335 RepID=UPI0018F75DF1|nr:DUF2306 domain-containing protein [Paenibacillus alkalitolerans]
MQLFSLLLIVHIAAGTVCLITGALAASARKRKGAHTLAGEVYHLSYVVVFLTSVVMSVMKWSEIAFLFYIALFSYGLALYGYLARKMRWRNWLRPHISGMLGSYIGIITAVLVVNGEAVSSVTGIPPLFLWFIPTIIGSPLIRMTIARATGGRAKREV